MSDDRPKLIGAPRPMRTPDEVKAALAGGNDASASQARKKRQTEILARLGFPHGVLQAYDEGDAICTIAEALMDHIDALRADMAGDSGLSLNARVASLERLVGRLCLHESHLNPDQITEIEGRARIERRLS